MTFIRDGFRLDCTGREHYAYGGIVGLDPAGRITEGYDGSLSGRLTWAELRELAEHMAGQWQVLADRAGQMEMLEDSAKR